ncbi:hypothetical protein B7494_g2725 [Chlorociboria aeruginascens]|nr:hypothetical protein B7494_g2725 [Chlorociboria aeruginascens]
MAESHPINLIDEVDLEVEFLESRARPNKLLRNSPIARSRVDQSSHLRSNVASHDSQATGPNSRINLSPRRSSVGQQKTKSRRPGWEFAEPYRDSINANGKRVVENRNREKSFSTALRDGSNYLQPLSLSEGEDESEAQFSPKRRGSAMQRSLQRHPTEDDELIELDCDEDSGLDLQFLRVESRTGAEKKDRKPSKWYPQRNGPIALPLSKCDSYPLGGKYLRPLKTVELKDGGFIWIKCIIKNCETGEVKVRGHRLQRCRELNGLLELKLNEVCFFYEVDLDDPRRRKSKVLSNAPNVRMGQDGDRFRDKVQASDMGGLTVRWRYTCTYDTASDRHNNIYRERTIEHLREHNGFGDFVYPDTTKRFEWRGDTVRGGAHRQAAGYVETSTPIIHVDKDRGGSTISIRSSTSDDDVIPISSFLQSVEIRYKRPKNRAPSLIMLDSPTGQELSLSQGGLRQGSKRSLDADGRQQKRPRLDIEHSVETTRGRLSAVNLNDQKTPQTFSGITDLTTPPSSAERTSHGGSSCANSIPRMSIFSTDLATPPPAGSIGLPFTPKPSSSRIESISLQRHAFKSRQQYTFGDAFCGAGGTTRGAVMAGLKVKWGFDFNPQPCETWHANFPTAKCYQMASHEFVGRAEGSENQPGDDVKVDILHLSPPCQYFSPAHTVDGQDDEMNIASLFAVASVLGVVKPRVVTLEQTFGIMASRFRFYFAALVQMFAMHSFSVRWAIIPLAQWGLPQRRLRLIIIASCPGEVLPSMPLPTHSEDPTPGLKPFRTISSTIRSIPLNAENHDPASRIYEPDKCQAPYDGNQILPRAMTTSGGHNYHPSGKRDFTLREYACLQGFPLEHVFRGSGIKRQIGNAVPPCVAKVLFRSIKRDLMKADGVDEGAENEGEEVISQGWTEDPHVFYQKLFALANQTGRPVTIDDFVTRLMGPLQTELKTIRMLKKHATVDDR